MSCHKADYSLLVVVSVNIVVAVAVEVFLIRCRIRMPLFAVMWIEAVEVVAFAVVVVVSVAGAFAGFGAGAVDIAVEPALGPGLSALLLSFVAVVLDIAASHILAFVPLSFAVSWLLFVVVPFPLISYSARSSISCNQRLRRRRRIFYQMFEEVCLFLCLASPELFFRFLIPYCHQPLGTCF